MAATGSPVGTTRGAGMRLSRRDLKTARSSQLGVRQRKRAEKDEREHDGHDARGKHDLAPVAAF